MHTHTHETLAHILCYWKENCFCTFCIRKLNHSFDFHYNVVAFFSAVILPSSVFPFYYDNRVFAVLYRIISFAPCHSFSVLRTIDNEWENRRNRQRVYVLARVCGYFYGCDWFCNCLKRRPPRCETIQRIWMIETINYNSIMNGPTSGIREYFIF